MRTYIIGSTLTAGAGARLKWPVTRLLAACQARPAAGHEGGRTVKRAAAFAALTTFALAGCADTTTHHTAAAAAAAKTAAAPPVPAYIARLEADGYTVTGSCALHGGQGIGQAWGNDDHGNGEMLIEAKTADEAATLAAAMNNFANAAAGSSGSLTITHAGNFVVITGPGGAVDSLGQAGC